MYYAVLADFGMSKSMKKDDSQSRCDFLERQKTNDAWLSPELMMMDYMDVNIPRVIPEGDIWAFGCVLLEVSYITW